MNSENGQRELDLVDIIGICWGWFIKFIWNPILFLFKYALRKWWIALIAIVIGLTASYVNFKLEPHYQGYLIYEVNAGKSSDYINEINLLSLTSAEYKAKYMNIPIEEAAKISELLPHAVYYQDSTKTSNRIDFKDVATVKGKEVLQNRFCIEVKSIDTIAFKHLEEGFVYYFSNNDFYKRLNNDIQRKRTTDLEFATAEAKRIDSIGEYQSVAIPGADKTIGGALLKTSSTLEDKIKLKEIYDKAAHKVYTFPEVLNVVSPIKVNQLATNHYLVTYKWFILVAIIIAYAIALCIQYRKKIIAFAKDNK